ncbi:patatin-like protein [Bradyrhizobium sp. AZCC 2289]|uniref:patatin-like protein n=1 Tax=Bradyrhizobium sp. AZCC 2289 TaxID=3117026 RepID=UPI002FF31D66
MDREIQKNLSILFRSRWLEPPFDGDRFLELLFDGLSAMCGHGDQPSSLLPPGHALDLAISITDFFGYPRDLKINTPLWISEREHELSWVFKYRNRPDQPSDLDDGNVAGLALAARATSSFPGAFPPVQPANLSRLLARRGLTWPNRAKFMAANFKHHIDAGVDPESASLLDGSIVNSKPFSAVLNMIRDQPAHRDVDRRVVHIEPDPDRASQPPDGQIPNFIRTLEGAILEIPLHAPIHRSLDQVHEFNRITRRILEVLKASYPELAGFVTTVTDHVPPTGDPSYTVEHWREAANALAAKEASYAYQVYARLKTFAIIDSLVELICELGRIDQASAIRTRFSDEVLRWADRRGAIPPEGSLAMADGSGSRPWIDFLLHFDAEFRRRRLSFVMRGLNLLYSQLEEPDFGEVRPDRIDDLKSRFQSPLGRLRSLRAGDFASEALRSLVVVLATRLRVAGYRKTGASVAARKDLDRDMDDVMEQLRQEFDLSNVDQAVDDIVALSMADEMPKVLRQEVLVYYIGFPFWDVWTYPISEWRAVEEHREIRVDRISPIDAVLLRNGVRSSRLRGAELRHFAGFFSRSRREHDYLWGRLDGAELLIDIVADAAAVEGASADIDVRALKRDAFRAILDTEKHHLLDESLLATVRSEIDKL